MDDPAHEFIDGEALAIVKWRGEQFALLGFSDAACYLLTYGDADIEVARRLIKAGCPPSLALEILT